MRASSSGALRLVLNSATVVFLERRADRAVTFRPAVTEELPQLAHLAHHFQVQVRDDQLILVAASLRDDLAARIDEITRAVEFADIPGHFVAETIDLAHLISVR